MNDPVDVLIIGAGASGAAVAWSLADTKMHILCLEQGAWMNPATYPSTGRDWEARFFGDYSPSPNIRARPEDYPINDDNSPIKVVNFNGVGGGTVMYTAHFPRLHPSDFRVRSLDGVADDWPIDYDTLAPFFEENDRMMGVSGLAGDPAVPPRNPPMPPLPLGRSGTRLAKAMNRLGWHWWPSDTTVATVDYEGRARCINLGHCTPACAQGAKASTDITYWPAAQRAGVELRTHCRVREITTNEHGMAAGVAYYDADGVEQFQAAHVVVLACNGVGTPRLLLNSASGRFPKGLANSSGLIGRNLMFHPYAQVYGYVDEPTDSNRAPPTCLWSKEFYETDLSRGFVRGYTFQFGRGGGPVAEAVASEAKGLIPWGAGHHAAFRRLNGHRLGLSAICEGPAGGTQPRHARPSAEGQPQHPGAADRVQNRGEYGADDGARRRPREGDPRRGGGDRHLRQQPHPLRRLAPSGHCPHGRRPGPLGRQRMGAVARREEPVHRRRQPVRHLRRREPDIHDPGPGALHRRPDEAAPGQSVRLRPAMPPGRPAQARTERRSAHPRGHYDPGQHGVRCARADDPAIEADIVATLGRDTGLVREALDQLARLAGLALAVLTLPGGRRRP
jgi:choline dehydrogenase-like flavoprotein